MARISGSVGQGGKNRRPDVVTIKYLVNAHIHSLQPMSSLQVSSTSDDELVEAIRVFQQRVVRLTAPDGRVDPGGRTLAALNRPGPTGAPLYYPTGPQQLLADIARPYIGATEAAGNKMGMDLRMQEIFDADYARMGPDQTDGYAWCSSFVSLCTQKLLRRCPFYTGINPPREASVRRFLQLWAPAQKCLIFSTDDLTHQPHKGDIVVFRFSHIGIVDTVNGSVVRTIEGNTSEAGSREGTTVRQQNRNFSKIRSFIRLPIPATYDVLSPFSETVVA